MEASALSHPVGLARVSLAAPLLRLRSDDQLLALFRAGHDEAFGTIHDRYRQRLFSYTRQMLGGSRSDAEDVLQDVFLRAYHALRVDGRPVALRAWLYRVAHNRCIDHLRRPAPAVEDIYDINRGVQTDPTTAAERREDLRRLVADVRALPEQQRSALLMREMEGLSYNELAAALGVTVPAIKSLLVRARVGLVEAVEARDTACTDIRTDLAAAFDRGVRPSGLSRRHLRECSRCREYRTALRGVEKRLNGLAPASGPLTTLAKVLGLGGAGSGAAAGGGAVAAGAGSGAAATVGTGAMAAAATKVVAAVAAAAVVGGGATAVERAEHHRAAPEAAHVAPTGAPAPAASAPLARRPIGFAGQRSVAAAGGARSGADARDAGSAAVVELRASGAPAVSSPGADPLAVEQTTGGVQAPDDTAPSADPSGAGATDAPGTPGAGPGGSGAATAGDATGDGATAGAGNSAGEDGTPSGTAAQTDTATSGTTTSSAGPATGDGPSGTVSPTTSAPIAQGASVAPADG